MSSLNDYRKLKFEILLSCIFTLVLSVFVYYVLPIYFDYLKDGSSIYFSQSVDSTQYIIQAVLVPIFYFVNLHYLINKFQKTKSRFKSDLEKLRSNC
mgnify:CR=1 FL=1